MTMRCKKNSGQSHQDSTHRFSEELKKKKGQGLAILVVTGKLVAGKLAKAKMLSVFTEFWNNL